MDIFYRSNPYRSDTPAAASGRIASPEILRSAAAFHRSLPGYAPTPLARLSQLARYLGIQSLWVKDEAYRFDLNAFKILGASYGIARVLAASFTGGSQEVTFEQLVSQRSQFQDRVLVTATDGNHGRAVAWAAQKFGCRAVVYMPYGTAPVRLEAIRRLGGQASIVDGNYDHAVRMATQHAHEKGWILVQDTSWPDYTEIPTYIMQGYTTLITEALEQLAPHRPSHILVQAGVGSLAGALQAYLSYNYAGTRPLFMVVESIRAACLYQSIASDDGQAVVIEGDLDTIMAGLACGVPSSLSWEILKANADTFIACSDNVARRGMRVLGNPLEGDERVVSGESGAVTTGLVYEILSNPEYAQLIQMLQLGPEAQVLVISTEGDTDPEHYRKVVW